MCVLQEISKFRLFFIVICYCEIPTLWESAECKVFYLAHNAHGFPVPRSKSSDSSGEEDQSSDIHHIGVSEDSLIDNATLGPGAFYMDYGLGSAPMTGLGVSNNDNLPTHQSMSNDMLAFHQQQMQYALAPHGVPPSIAFSAENPNANSNSHVSSPYGAGTGYYGTVNGSIYPTAKTVKRPALAPTSTSASKTTTSTTAEPRPKKRRRQRQPWTQEEVDLLQLGVRQYHDVYNIWQAIKCKYFSDSPNRTAVDLKDKYRNLNNPRSASSVEKKTYHVLNADHTLTKHSYKNRYPNAAAAKVASRGDTEIYIREAGSNVVHVYKGWRIQQDAPSFMAEVKEKKGAVKKVWCGRVKKLRTEEYLGDLVDAARQKEAIRAVAKKGKKATRKKAKGTRQKLQEEEEEEKKEEEEKEKESKGD